METCPAADHVHHEGANYYVSVIRPGRSADDARLLAGPYKTHGEALDAVPSVRRWADSVDPRAPWYAYGTTAMAADYTEPGIANRHGWTP